MRRFRLLPLGVDLGRARLRIALSEYGGDREIRLRAVAARDVPSEVGTDAAMIGALIEEMIGELGVRERRCVAALGAPASAMRVVRFPKMTWTERLQAAKFEATRFAPNASDERVRVRVHPVDRATATYAIGVAPEDAVATIAAKLQAARLRPIAIDHDAFALERVLPAFDAIVDIGAYRGTLHAYGAQPLSFVIDCGGYNVSRAIARQLSIDEASAERRKRILGGSGAGPEVRSELVSQVAAAIEKARARSPIRRVALVGNSVRLPGIAEDIEAISGAIVEAPVAEILTTSDYPGDVLRAAAPDWTLAAALTTWPIAA